MSLSSFEISFDNLFSPSAVKSSMAELSCAILSSNSRQYNHETHQCNILVDEAVTGEHRCTVRWMMWQAQGHCVASDAVSEGTLRVG